MFGYSNNNLHAEIVVDIDIPSSSSSTNTEETTLPESADKSFSALGCDPRSLPEKTVDKTYRHIKRQLNNKAVNVDTAVATKHTMFSKSRDKVDDVTQPSCSRDLIEDEVDNDTSGIISPEKASASTRKMADTVPKTIGYNEIKAVKSPERETMVPSTVDEQDQHEEDSCFLNFLVLTMECCKCNIM